MKFRYARHSSDLDAQINFYTKVLNFEILGEFKNHNHYDGVFLGKKNQNWHLEFTMSEDLPNSVFGEDDLLVFYPESEEEYGKILENIEEFKIKIYESKNPYWKENGILIKDADQHGVMISNQFLRL